MNALIRKFRVASTTGVVMAMAGVLAMAPMSNAMAKSQKGKEVRVVGSSTSGFYAAWSQWSVNSYNACGGVNYEIKTYKQYKKGSLYTLESVNKCK